MAGRPQPVHQLHRVAVQGPLHQQPVQRWRQHRVDAQAIRLFNQAQQALDHQPPGDTGTAAVDAPAAFQRNVAPGDAVVMQPGLVAVGKGRVRAGVVAVALAQRRLRHQGLQAYRVGQAQRMQQGIAPAQRGQRFGPAQVGMHVHQADLAAKKAGAFTALKQPHRPAAVAQRPVKQAQPVGAQQVLLDQRHMVGRLGGGEQPVDDGVHHGQGAVVDAGVGVAWVQQVTGLARRVKFGDRGKRGKTGQHPIDHQPALKIRRHRVGPGLHRARLISAAQA